MAILCITLASIVIKFKFLQGQNNMSKGSIDKEESELEKEFTNPCPRGTKVSYV